MELISLGGEKKPSPEHLCGRRGKKSHKWIVWVAKKEGENRRLQLEEGVILTSQWGKDV